jgi:hypothetical protein
MTTYARYKSSSYVVHILADGSQGHPPAICGQWPHRVWSVTDRTLRPGDTICTKCIKVEPLRQQTDPLLTQVFETLFTPGDLAEQRDAAREVSVQTHVETAREIARQTEEIARLTRLADSLINERDQQYLRIGVYVAALEQIRSAYAPETPAEQVKRLVRIANVALTTAPPEKAAKHPGLFYRAAATRRTSPALLLDGEVIAWWPPSRHPIRRRPVACSWRTRPGGSQVDWRGRQRTDQ